MHKPGLKMTRQTHSFSRICESLREREREELGMVTLVLETVTLNPGRQWWVTVMTSVNRGMPALSRLWYGKHGTFGGYGSAP